MKSLSTQEQNSLLRRTARTLHIGQWDVDDLGRIRKGWWSQSYTGARFWPLDPRADEIFYDDMVIGLARAARYRGQTREFYSVAEHSVLVSIYAPQIFRAVVHPFDAIAMGVSVRDVARAGLLHDAPEAWIGDVARPLKRQRVMRGFCRLERKWDAAVVERFELNTHEVIHWCVKMADNRLVLDETEALMLDPDMWPRSGRYLDLEPLGADIAGLEWKQAADVFSQRFQELFPDWLETA